MFLKPLFPISYTSVIFMHFIIFIMSLLSTEHILCIKWLFHINIPHNVVLFYVAVLYHDFTGMPLATSLLFSLCTPVPFKMLSFNYQVK